MASITLVEASKLGLNDLATGVIENIVTVNEMFQFLPFSPVDGNAKAYNRENVLGDAQALAIGGTITAKAAASYTQVVTPLTTLIGDAEVNGLLQAQNIGGNAGNDLVALQVASKAKSVGRLFQNYVINGDSAVSGQFDGLAKLVSAGQTVTGAFSFESLDELLHKVKSKDGQVDALIMNSAQIRAYRTLVRAMGGTTGEYVEVNGIKLMTYAGVPILRNDWILDEAVYAVNFDDGSEKVGIAGLTGVNEMGVSVKAVGASETKDEDIFRIKFYSSFAVFSDLAVAKLVAA